MCLNHALKVYLLVRAVAERLRFRVAAAAQPYLGAAAKPEHFAVLVDDFEVSFDPN